MLLTRSQGKQSGGGVGNDTDWKRFFLQLEVSSKTQIHIQTHKHRRETALLRKAVGNYHNPPPKKESAGQKRTRRCSLYEFSLLHLVQICPLICVCVCACVRVCACLPYNWGLVLIHSWKSTHDRSPPQICQRATEYLQPKKTRRTFSKHPHSPIDTHMKRTHTHTHTHTHTQGPRAVRCMSAVSVLAHMNKPQWVGFYWCPAMKK